MAKKIKLVEIQNPKIPNGKTFFVPEIANIEVESIETLAKTMSAKLSMTEEEYLNALTIGTETMKFFLSQGESISIKGFGTFHPATIPLNTAPSMRNKANAEMMQVDFEPSEELQSRLDDHEFEKAE